VVEVELADLVLEVLAELAAVAQVGLMIMDKLELLTLVAEVELEY
jgi:hypothetical protein